jgi:hypothetical protein
MDDGGGEWGSTRGEDCSVEETTERRRVGEQGRTGLHKEEYNYISV